MILRDYETAEIAPESAMRAALAHGNRTMRWNEKTQAMLTANAIQSAWSKPGGSGPRPSPKGKASRLHALQYFIMQRLAPPYLRGCSGGHGRCPGAHLNLAMNNLSVKALLVATSTEDPEDRTVAVDRRRIRMN